MLTQILPFKLYLSHFHTHIYEYFEKYIRKKMLLVPYCYAMIIFSHLKIFLGNMILMISNVLVHDCPIMYLITSLLNWKVLYNIFLPRMLL